MKKGYSCILIIILVLLSPSLSKAWHDETHLAIGKVVGYYKWYNAAGADMTKIKAGNIEGYNHFTSNPAGTVVTPEMVLEQVSKYNKMDKTGHLYGAIIASLRDYIKNRNKGKYGGYHLAFCLHYVGDLSQPLHNVVSDPSFNKLHQELDGTIDNKALEQLDKIKIYPIEIGSEKDLAKEIARIANLSISLGFKIIEEKRPMTKEEAYIQAGHSASLFRAMLNYLKKMNG